MLSISILLIIFSLTIPRLNFLNNYFLYHEQDLLLSTLSYVQHKAIAANAAQFFWFDITKNTYSYRYPKNKVQTYTLKHGVTFGFLPGSKGPPSKAEHLIVHPITFDTHQKNHTATCFPNGTITPGTIYLIDKNKKTMVALTCSISAATYIRKYSYEDGRWIMKTPKHIQKN